MVKINWVVVEMEMAKRNLTLKEFAAATDIKPPVLKKYLNMGKASYWAAKQMADVLGLSLFDVIQR